MRGSAVESFGEGHADTGELSLFTLAFLIACGHPVDPEWSADASYALAQAVACVELGERLTDQCANASVGAGEAPHDAIAQQRACRVSFYATSESLASHPAHRSLEELNEAGQQIYKATQDTLGIARRSLARTEAEVARACANLPTPAKAKVVGGDGTPRP